MRYQKHIKILLVCAILTGSLLVTGISANTQSIGVSGLLSIFNSSWTQFQENDPAEEGIIEPGVGVQELDAEYLVSNSEGNTLSLGLQAGVDLNKGTTTVTPVPEPATLLLFGAGLIGLSGVVRKRSKKG